MENGTTKQKSTNHNTILMPQFDITLLGTGGGRFATITQKRRTAGIRIVGDRLNLHLDPGPGALVYSIHEGLNPQKLNAVFVSHCHPDHYTDAEVLIEAMTRGMTKKRGVLVASKSVLGGSSTCEPSISAYHQEMVERKIEAVPNMRFEVGSVKVLVTEARHSDPDAVGFRFETEEFGAFAYTSDTEYFPEISRCYEGVRLLMLCVMRPAGKPWKGHMTTNDAIEIVKAIQPEQAVLTHLGMQMIFQGPAREAKLVEVKTGVPTVAAVDGMRISFGEAITIQAEKGRVKQGLDTFL
ncbi:MAG TPA: MBL fold metallo-hydrolase [Candidatus Bathyarchaeia archaeon]